MPAPRRPTTSDISDNGLFDQPVTGTDFTGSGAMGWAGLQVSASTFKYTISRNKLMTVMFSFEGTTVNGTPNTALHVIIPAGKTCSDLVFNMGQYFDGNGVFGPLKVFAIPGATTLLFLRLDGANWPLGSTNIYGQITFPIS